MSSRLESRLREILREQRPGSHPADDARTQSPPPAPDVAPARALLRTAADVLDGDLVETPAGTCIVVDRFYPADHRHGLARIGDFDGGSFAARDELALIGGRPEAAEPRQRTLLFVDLETTGLAGGAGTYAFLVGCAYFEPHGFRTRQYFLPGYQHERTLLDAVDGLVRQSAGLVSYNGKSFDVPVLETRFQFNRLTPPFDGMAHVDMLHIARRFWRAAPPSLGAWPDSDTCRLTTIERMLFGVRRVGDVPGGEIPGRYFNFMRTGQAEPLLPVFEHNRLDLLSLAAITARALVALRDAPDGCRNARESFASGRLLERAGRLDVAARCYQDATERSRCERGPDAAVVRTEAFRALALGHRRAGRFEAAAGAWDEIAADRYAVPKIRREALEALAIHYEHRTRDLAEARRFAQLSLAERVGTMGMDAGRHRLARLERKLERRGPEPCGPGDAALFN